MRKHKLIELQKIIEERIGSLTEEVEIAPDMRLIPLYIAACLTLGNDREMCESATD
jgi:hypothetical protein